jgi:hypothetical protein
VTIRTLALLALAALILAACATQPPPSTTAPGFWLGCLHGLIAPFSLVASLFRDVRIYAFPNDGGWYDLGFYLGVAGAVGGGINVTLRRGPSSPTA